MLYTPFNKRHIVAITCWFLSLSGLYGKGKGVFSCDSIQFSGQVLSLEKEKPLAYSTIHDDGGHFNITTDREGRFWARICSGTYSLHISHLICEHIDLRITLSQDTVLTLYLPSINRHLAPAVVTGQRDLAKHPDGGLTIKRDALRRLNSLSAGQVMENLPGVRGLTTGATLSKPMINGMYGYRTLIINQGIRQEGQNWGQEHAPEIDLSHAKEIEVVKGPLGFIHGSEALGGLIIINPPSIFNNSDEVSGNLDITAGTNGRPYGMAGLTEGKLTSRIPVYWRLQGTLKQAGNLKTPHYFTDNTGYREQNWGWGLGTHYGPVTTDLYYSRFYNSFGVYSGAHIGNLTDLNLAIQGISSPIDRGFSYSLANPRQEVLHELFKARVFYKLSNHQYIKILYARQFNQRQEFDLHWSSQSGPNFDYKLTTHTLDLSYEFENKKVFQQLGTNLMYQGNTFRGRFFIPNFEHYGIGGYYYARKTSGKWDWSGAIRGDIRDLTAYYFVTRDSIVSPHTQFANLSGSLSGTYHFTPQRTATLIFSRNWRAPMPNELYSEGIHHGTASYEEGNANLRPELAHKAELQYALQHKRHSLWVATHVQHVSGFINLIPASQPKQTIRGAFPFFFYDASDALFRSLNYQYRLRLNSTLSIAQHADLLWAWDLNRNTYLAQMPPFLTGVEIQYESKSVQAKLEGRYVFRQFRFEDNTDFAPPPPGYLLLSAEVFGELSIAKQLFKYYMRGSNLGNTSYRDYLDRFRYFIDRPGVHIQVGLSWDF